MSIVVKFWKEDFRYTERYFSYDGYCYTFTVRGESANYLMNKYGLGYPNVEVNYFTDDGSMSVRSSTENKLKIDITDIDDEEDLKELRTILQETVDLDMRNYEEYMCDDGYKRDSRWK